VRPKTVVRVGLDGTALTPVRQQMADPRVPVLTTTYVVGEEEESMVEQTAFAVVPEPDLTSSPGRVQRLEGHVGTQGWAQPPEEAHPAFRSVAWGANRPVRYRIAVPPGSRQQVALGFCESYRKRPGQRVFRLEVEGSEPVRFDPLEAGARNEPQVVLFDAEDRDGDGAVSVDVNAASNDPNTYLNVLWVFSPDVDLAPAALIRGALDEQAEIVVNAGAEMAEGHAPRIDLVRFTADSDTLAPVVEVTTGRKLDAKAGQLWAEGRPFVVTRPEAIETEMTDAGARLVLPRGTTQADVFVLHGADASVPDLPDPEVAQQAAYRYWQEEAPIPYDRLRVSDVALQHLLDASLRTVYQSREVVDGHPQFQPGMALYRGLWTHDAAYLIDTALMLGDTLTARRALEGLLTFQRDDGQVEVMRPHTMNRETALTTWLMTRYAALSGDDAWLRQRWERLVRAVDWMAALRAQTLDDPDTPYYGLLPPGFADGGLGGVHAEYSGVYWTLISLEAALDAAHRLDRTEHVDAWQTLYDEMLASWRAAARRDVRHTADGHPYLPVRIGDTTATAPPQQAQWMFIEAVLHGDFIAPDDSLVTGTLAVLDDAEVQGLVRNVGWQRDGIWAYFGGWYGALHLAAGHRDRAADILYAFANHATPHGALVEEQRPKGESPRTAGDYPHAWGSSLMVRYAGHLIAAEHDDDLVLLDGVPPQWLAPGDTLALDGWRTPFGPVTLQARVDAFGREATIVADPIGEPGQPGQVRINLRPFKTLGYLAEDGTALPDEQVLSWGEPVRLRVRAAD
jgi:hypothetical protein